MARDAMSWMVKYPHRAVALLDAAPGGHWARSVLSDIIQEDRRRRAWVYFEPQTVVDMPENVAVNICIELLQGDLAVLVLAASTDRGRRLGSIWDQMISAYVREHRRQTGQEIMNIELTSDGILETEIHIVSRRTVDADRTEPGERPRVRYRWRDFRLI